jgi:hypothetical protein
MKASRYFEAGSAVVSSTGSVHHNVLANQALKRLSSTTLHGHLYGKQHKEWGSLYRRE